MSLDLTAVRDELAKALKDNVARPLSVYARFPDTVPQLPCVIIDAAAGAYVTRLAFDLAQVNLQLWLYAAGTQDGCRLIDGLLSDGDNSIMAALEQIDSTLGGTVSDLAIGEAVSAGRIDLATDQTRSIPAWSATVPVSLYVSR